MAVQARLGLGHLMASSAIPFIFPAEPLDFEGEPEWFGDGSMRQSAPISPAVHLGAERVLVIGAGRMKEPEGRRHQASDEHPSMAQVAGHALSNIFLDALAVDVERLRRINRTLALLPRETRASTALRPIELLVIAPSRRLDDLAGEHQASLPNSVRAMLRAFGVYSTSSRTTKILAPVPSARLPSVSSINANASGSVRTASRFDRKCGKRDRFFIR